jgi:uncharacterized protein
LNRWILLFDQRVSNLDTPWEQWTKDWETTFSELARAAMADSDAGHDFEHVQRVVINCTQLGPSEQANPSVVLPAAWLHDCVAVAKNSPLRSQASRLAADHAVELITQAKYPAEFIPDIHHAIAAHSFSAKIECLTREAKVVQDADRLEALGAIGIARCLMTGGSLGQRLYDPAEPFPLHRPARDNLQSVDHFFAKLFRLPQTMQTDAGHREALQRTNMMRLFLEQLCHEIGEDVDMLRKMIDAI